MEAAGLQKMNHTHFEESINSSLLNVFLKVDYEELKELNIDMIDNMFTI